MYIYIFFLLGRAKSQNDVPLALNSRVKQMAVVCSGTPAAISCSQAESGANLFASKGKRRKTEIPFLAQQRSGPRAASSCLFDPGTVLSECTKGLAGWREKAGVVTRGSGHTETNPIACSAG